MKDKLVRLLLIISISYTGCSPKVGQKVTSHPNEVNLNEWTPRGPLFFVAPSGVYKGAIPCSDCPGVEVTLNFKDDNSLVKSQRYIQSKTKKTSKHTGSWVVIEDNIVRVTFSDNSPQEFYKAQNGGHLILLNNEKELKIDPAQAQFFIFNPD
ncbi:copper resistance protein NlpE N-terminal domain-containing protein [Albibacterium profundi]|uniref:Copper resistance protein NlpE N-terminal domain-containing protein n=1 Tax=Albibacterium profundi TaxID=3134906 RepID=A0ABV5CDD8_9SPHI